MPQDAHAFCSQRAVVSTAPSKTTVPAAVARGRCDNPLTCHNWLRRYQSRSAAATTGAWKCPRPGCCPEPASRLLPKQDGPTPQGHPSEADGTVIDPRSLHDSHRPGQRHRIRRDRMVNELGSPGRRMTPSRAPAGVSSSAPPAAARVLGGQWLCDHYHWQLAPPSTWPGPADWAPPGWRIGKRRWSTVLLGSDSCSSALLSGLFTIGGVVSVPGQGTACAISPLWVSPTTSVHRQLP